MKMNEKSSKAIVITLSIIVTVSVVNFFLDKATDSIQFKKEMIENRVELMKLIAKAANTNDSLVTQKYTNICLTNFGHLPYPEKDSLKSFFTFIILETDSIDTDILNTLKDNGTIDTTNMFKPSSKIIIYEFSKRLDMEPSEFIKGSYNQTNRMSESLHKMNNTSDSIKNTYSLRRRMQSYYKKRDSIYKTIYNRLFRGQLHS